VQTEHKLKNVTNNTCIKTVINAQLKINRTINPIKDINRLTALVFFIISLFHVVISSFVCQLVTLK